MNMQAYREIMRRKCRDSFWQFLLYGYGAHYNPKGKRWLDPSIHKPLCDWFEHHVKQWLEQRKSGKGNSLSLMILVPRDVGKTTTITQAGMAWIHLQDPDISTYLGSERTDFAMDLLGPIKAVLSGEDTSSRFAWLYGSWEDKQRQWSASQLVHAARTNMSRKEPSFGTWGVESGITGKHPDVLCLDDPVSYEKMAQNGNWLQTVNDHMDSLVPVLPSDGLMILVGTRYHDGDHFGVGIDKEGVASVSGMPMPHLKAIDPEGRWHAYFLSARDHEDKPSIPSVWSEQRLNDFKKRNPMRYAAQVLNDPMSGDNNPLPLSKLEECLVKEKDVPKNYRVTFHLDTAFKTPEQQAKGDYSVIVKMAHSTDGTGHVYFLGAWGSNRMKGEDYGEKLLAEVQAVRNKGKRVSMITDEQGIGGKQNMWELLLKTWFADAGMVMPPLTLLNRGGKKKIIRHIEAANFINNDKVFFVDNAPGLKELFDQLSKIGNSRNDDYIDAFSDCFNKGCYSVMHRKNNQLDDDQPLEYSMDHYLKQNWSDPREVMYNHLEQYGGNFYDPI